MKSIAQMGFSRATNILLSDKKRATDVLLNDVIKCDILSILNNYFELNENDCRLAVNTLPDGRVEIDMSVVAIRGRDFWKV